LNSKEASILLDTLNTFHKLSFEEFTEFLNACNYQTFKKKEHLLISGEYHRGIYFIISGSVGLYELIDGKEMYQDFYLPGTFAHELKSLTTQQQSDKNLIALSATNVYYLDRQKLLNLYEKSPVYERLGRNLLEHLLTQQHELSSALQSLKPEERYQYLQEKNPEFLQSIPLTYLASYLGLARETLSRIRAKK